MLGILGHIELSMGDLDSARSHLVESLDILRTLNDRHGIAYETFTSAWPSTSAAHRRPPKACSPNRSIWPGRPG